MACQRVVILTLVSLFSVSSIAGQTPDRELDKARQYIQSRQFAEAARTLEAALPETESLPDDIQVQAQTAMHFYAAVAYSALNRDDDALLHLEEVLRLSPDIRAVDPAKYDARFVKLFNRVRAEDVEYGQFEELYPGFAFTAKEPPPDSFAWEANPAMEILASRVEKREWQNTAPGARQSFTDEFWKNRDQTPETEQNEFREQFERRMGFADTVFSTPGERGALTDRGKVFILLGEPAQVRRRAITSRDAIQAFNVGSVGIVGGTIEYWVYTRDQLQASGVAHSKSTVTYRFVTHQGIGDNVLQKDGMPMNTLSMAVKAATGN